MSRPYNMHKKHVGQANERQDILKDEDLELLEALHSNFRMKKATKGLDHAVIASMHDGWRTRANDKPKRLVRKQVESLPVLNCK